MINIVSRRIEGYDLFFSISTYLRDIFLQVKRARRIKWKVDGRYVGGLPNDLLVRFLMKNFQTNRIFQRANGRVSLPNTVYTDRIFCDEQISNSPRYIYIYI